MRTSLIMIAYFLIGAGCIGVSADIYNALEGMPYFIVVPAVVGSFFVGLCLVLGGLCGLFYQLDEIIKHKMKEKNG